MTFRSRLAPALALVLVFASSCSPVKAIGIRFLYRRAELPRAQVIRDVCYLPSSGCEDEAHKLDLYLPAGEGWPVIVFAHGGGWNQGDKALRVGGADVYANIGRYYASQGIGAAVINYRLQPTTDWRGQLEDVRQATRWVHDHIREHGGRPDEIFLMGHSAGTHLTSLAALDTDSPDAVPIRGVIAVSGAGLDMTDRETYELGEDIHYYEKRFRGSDSTGSWRVVASPVHYATRNAPPFLILHAGGESRGLRRQAQCLREALARVGVENRIVVVPGQSHSRIVLALSRPDRTAAPAILEFVRRHESRAGTK